MLLSLLPIVMRENNFALHGGTAINLFREDMPRYSVDIDLTYVNIEDWNTTMHNINGSLTKLNELHMSREEIDRLNAEARVRREAKEKEEMEQMEKMPLPF